MYYRLSILSFLVYAVPGAWLPILSLRLEKELGFTPMQTAAAWSSWPIGAIVASLIVGQIADRWVALERCLAGASLMTGVLLFCLAQATSPWTVCAITIAVCLFMVPTFTLSVTYCLTHLQNPEAEFGRVRLWGTVGWVSQALLLYIWFLEPSWLQPVYSSLGRRGTSYADSQSLGALLSFCLAGYALTLPHTPPLGRSKSWLAPAAALPLLRQRSFAVFCLCVFMLQLTFPFFAQQTSLLLEHRGIPREWVPPVLTIAQWSEVAALWLLPVISVRLGMKGTLLLGLCAWLVGMSIMSIGRPTWLLIGSLTMNGLLITCFLIRGQVFVARQAGPDIRTSAQGLVATLAGIGGVLGNNLVGTVRDAVDRNFHWSYAIGAALALVNVVIFYFGFRETSPVADRDQTDEPPVARLENPSAEGMGR